MIFKQDFRNFRQMESAPRFQVLQLTRILLHFFEKLLRVAINVDRAIEIFAACRCGDCIGIAVKLHGVYTGDFMLPSRQAAKIAPEFQVLQLTRILVNRSKVENLLIVLDKSVISSFYSRSYLMYRGLYIGYCL